MKLNAEDFNREYNLVKNFIEKKDPPITKP